MTDTEPDGIYYKELAGIFAIALDAHTDHLAEIRAALETGNSRNARRRALRVLDAGISPDYSAPTWLQERIAP